MEELVGFSSEPGKHVKEGGKRFRATSRILDREPGSAITMKIMATEDSKAHGETMVVIGFDLNSTRQGTRVDFERVLQLDHVLAKFFEFPRHAGDAISLLFAGVGDAADFGGAVEERGDGSKS